MRPQSIVLAPSLVAAFVAFPRAGHCQEPTSSTAASDQVVLVSELDTRRWYGWQVLAVDVPLTVTMEIGAATATNELLWGGFGGFVVGAPIVHIANRNRSSTVLSISTHLLLPTAGYAFGRLAVGRMFPDTSSNLRNGLGVGLGAVAATAIDAIYTSWGRYGDVTVVQSRGLTVTPWIGGSAGGLMVSGTNW